MKRLMAATSLAAMLAAPAVSAAVSDEDFAAVKQMLEQALERIGELEGQQAAAQTPSAATVKQVETNSAAIEKMSWAERIRLKGDFRYRYQNDAVTDRVDRNRQRIRARLALIADATENVEVGLGLGTGGDDPVSANQTLGGGGSTKDIRLDLAYFKWNAATGTDVYGGKFVRPLKVAGKSGLQWDSDWRPEGIAVSYDEGMYFGNALFTWLESDSRVSASSSPDGDENAWFVQGGLQGKTDLAKWQAGIGYSEIGAKGKQCYFDLSTPGEACAGNQTDAFGLYLYDFEVFNVFGSATFEVSDMPLTVFADWIKNDAADDFDQGFEIGAQLGEAKKRGSWQVKAYYEELEANATLGFLSNSNFGGGGTAGEGYVVAAKYATTDTTTIGFTYFDVDKDPDQIFGPEFDIKTFQLDFGFKYK